MFIERTLARYLPDLGRKYPVILVSGARQVGKSTLLKHTVPAKSYVTLDDPAVRERAQTEPKLFIETLNTPAIIDEVQYAPELFPLIKLKVDANQQMGQFWLSGLQQFNLMQNVTESLAGRVGILNLNGLSTRELLGDANAAPFPERLRETPQRSLPIGEIFKRIWRGSYPALHGDRQLEPEAFYPSYVQTYLERDVRSLSQIGNLQTFLRFMRLAAARTGQLQNVQELSQAADVSVTAGRAWLSVLEASGVVFRLEPYFGNISKRLIKRPKLYFTDTGLAAWLAGWQSAEALANGAAAGAFLETYVVSEIRKSYQHHARSQPLHFYRDHDGREVDLLVVRNQQALSLEIKRSAKADARLAKQMNVAEKIGLQQGGGAVLYLNDQALPLDADTQAIPIGWL